MSNDTTTKSILQVGLPPLDIKYFRDEKMIQQIIKSQKCRYPVDTNVNEETQQKQLELQNSKVELVNTVIALDKEWRQERYKYDELKSQKNKETLKIKDIAKNKEYSKDKKKALIEEMRVKIREFESPLNESLHKQKELEIQRNMIIAQIGNLVPTDMGIVSTYDEELSPIIYSHSLKNITNNNKLFTHGELVQKLDIVHSAIDISGSRSFFLKGAGCYLNQAIINYGLEFLKNRDFIAMHCPFFIRQSIMGLCAQLEDFNEQLYRVSGEGEDKYLIATSEQALCCYFKDKEINKKDLPIQIAGYSTCFRKEVGNSSDSKGIFRVHQFEKVEQFCVTEPDKSWLMMEEMIKNSMQFYESLKIPFRVINIVSGHLNNAAAKKYDLEAHFPGSNNFRELVSCSNCLDYQSRRLNTKITSIGQNPHMLNSTLTASERTLCCILENYQTETGVKVPVPLIKYMPMNMDFIPFVK